MKPAILVLGATGAIGQGVVRAAVDAGWPVVAVASDAAGLQELERRHAGKPVHALIGSVEDDAAADVLVAALQKLGRPFVGVVSALAGASVRGRLLEQPAAWLRQTFEEAVLPQLVAARHLLPWLAASGRNCSYVVIGGPGGRHPWAGYGHRSVAQAAVRMLVRVLHAEARTYAVRLQLLEVESPVRTSDNDLHACPQWPGVDAIGRRALELIEHRNDGRCTEAVIDFRHSVCEGGAAPERDDVDSMLRRPSYGTERLTLELDQAPESDSGFGPSTSEAQEMDSCASELPARCRQDVRKLLETFIPTKKNQERTR